MCQAVLKMPEDTSDWWIVCAPNAACRQTACRLRASLGEDGHALSAYAQNTRCTGVAGTRGLSTGPTSKIFWRAKKTLAKGGALTYKTLRAEVVELVDTLGSGSSGGSSVGVRVSPSAPFFKAVAVTCCDGFLFLFEAVE